jgi:hypothetical protein
LKEYVVFLNVPRGHKTVGWELGFFVEARSREEVAKILGLELCPGSKTIYQLPPELARFGTPNVSIWEMEEIFNREGFIDAVEKAVREAV